MYNSCTDRHCPLCCGARRATWLDKTRTLLLPGVTGGPVGSPASGPSDPVHVDEEVVVIDQDCAAAGYSIDSAIPSPGST